jgi:hypothetical protein
VSDPELCGGHRPPPSHQSRGTVVGGGRPGAAVTSGRTFPARFAEIAVLLARRGVMTELDTSALIRRLQLNEWTEQITQLGMSVSADGGAPHDTNWHEVKGDLDELEERLVSWAQMLRWAGPSLGSTTCPRSC